MILRLAAAAVLFLAACSTPESRIKKRASQFAAYPAEAQVRIRAGEIAPGFDADMVRMALGEPSRKTMRSTANATQEVWIYGDAHARPGVGFGFGAGTMGGFGGVSVGSDARVRDRAHVVFEGGKVVEYETPKN